MKRLYAAFALIIIASGYSAASTFNADTVAVSTISGLSNSNGITFSSYVYFSDGSSLTLQGAGGYVTTNSSVIASAYFGDGSHLTSAGDTLLAATQTFSGANTFLSSFTVQSMGNQIIISTSNSTSNILISSSGAISFYPSLHNSSSTIVPQANSTNPNLGPCVAGSTLTITTTGGRVEAEFSGITGNDSGGGGAAPMSILQDGQFARDMSSSRALVYSDYGFASIGGATFSYLFDAPAPGAHSYCLTIGDASGTQVTLVNSAGLATNLFFVKEIK